MADASVLETFQSPQRLPYVIEHVAEEFTSLCPMTGHPDFGRFILRYCPAQTCVEFKSFQLYYQSYRAGGLFY